MIRAVFRKSGGSWLGFKVSGHAGQARRGRDLVCAAVTSAVRLTECQLNDVLGLGFHSTVDEKGAGIEIISEKVHPSAQAAIGALYLYFTELKSEYPGCIEVLEV